MSWGTSASWAPAWSQDGAWLAIEHDDPTGTHGGREQVVTLVHAGDWRAVRLSNAFQPAFSPDGRHLAVVGSGNGRYLADVMNADGSGCDDRLDNINYPPVVWVP